MSAAGPTLDHIADLLGGSAVVRSAAAVTEGWSARYGGYPWIRRCAVEGADVSSVIVKTRRPDGHSRAGDTTSREWAALALLEEIECDAGPRVLAHDDASGVVVLEDLGSGSALEDLLVEDDPEQATAGFTALAGAVGRMQAATRGRQDAFYARLGDRASPRRDRLCLARMALADRWTVLRDVVTRHHLPAPAGAAGDVDEMLAILADPGELLVLSNGDLAPQNCRLARGRARLLDFEDAQFQHAILDAAQLRFPFYAGPCWSRTPAEVAASVEAAYRAEVAKRCPALRDDATYLAGMSVATAAWAVTRLVRLPRLLAENRPHSLGSTKRGQLLDTIQSAVDAASAAATMPALRAWFEELAAALRRRWPGLPASQDVYPAYRLDQRARGR